RRTPGGGPGGARRHRGGRDGPRLHGDLAGLRGPGPSPRPRRAGAGRGPRLRAAAGARRGRRPLRPLPGRRRAGGGGRGGSPPAPVPSGGRDMIRAALLGYGKMGRRLEELAPEHGFTVVLRADSRTPFDPQAYAEEGVEVAIDFSIPAAVVGNVERMAALGIPLVVGTTGWMADLATVRAAVQRHGSALLYGANFSVGVQIFYRLVAEAARRFAADPSYDAWGYEI